MRVHSLDGPDGPISDDAGGMMDLGHVQWKRLARTLGLQSLLLSQNTTRFQELA